MSKLAIVQEGLIPFDLHTTEHRMYVCSVVYSENDIINIKLIVAPNCMKHFLDYLTDKFKCNKVTFCGLINLCLIKALEGFKPRQVFFDPLGEEITILEGIWKTKTG